MKPTQSNQTLALLFALFLLILSSCASKTSMLGKWQTDEPTHITFDFKADGSVMLISDKGTFPAWHFKTGKDDTVQLVDGMGRRQEYRYTLTGDSLKFYKLGVDGEAVYRFIRLK